jgi:hypothetical protein
MAKKNLINWAIAVSGIIAAVVVDHCIGYLRHHTIPLHSTAELSIESDKVIRWVESEAIASPVEWDDSIQILIF